MFEKTKKIEVSISSERKRTRELENGGNSAEYRIWESDDSWLHFNTKKIRKIINYFPLQNVQFVRKSIL